VFYLGTDPKKVEAVSAEFQDEINGLSAGGLTEDELIRAKKKLLGSEAIRHQSNSAFAASVAVDELLGLGFDNHRKRKEQIESVSLDEIRRVAAKYFVPPSRVEVIVRPPKKTAANSILSPQS
jgi:zinc protease